MVYQGSKRKLVKYLKPIIEKFLENNDRKYVEPFVGGANLIDYINCKERYGYDINFYLISLLKHFQNNTNQPYIEVSKELWSDVKQHYKNGNVENKYENWFIGYVGFIGSFCGKFFDGYGNREIAPERNLIKERYNNLLKQVNQPTFNEIQFETKSFVDLDISNSIIYLDPPYTNTRQYNSIKKFDKQLLIDKCKEWNKHNNIILLSELEPLDNDNWVCIWKKDYKYQMGTKAKNDVVEKLFLYFERD